VHQLGRADNRIDRARLDAFGAADAVVLKNHHHLVRRVPAPGAVIRDWCHAQQMRQCARTGIAPRRAVVDANLAARQRLRIRCTTIKPALPALGLREQAFDAFGQGQG